MPSSDDITEGRNMFGTLFGARPILNSSNEFNFTNGYNSSFDDFENSNASRHFADELPRQDVVYTFPMLVILILSFVPCGLIVVGSLLWFTRRLRQRLPRSTRSRRQSETTEARTAAFQRTRRPDVLSVVHEGANGNHQMLFPNCDEVPLDTPSSIYPDDMVPSYTDSTRNLYSDTITTPLSNNSIITMTMRNNYLIVETEERVPINCSILMRDQSQQGTVPNFSSFATPEAEDYHSADLLDDAHCYSDEHLPNVCLLGDEERRSFYKPTTSRQADEEDQHVELFHKHILPLTTSSSCEQGTAHTIPSCSYEFNDGERSSSGDDGPAVERVVVANTGFTQSDLTGSSCSASRHPRTDYGYSNQSEYVTSEFPLRKRASSSKLLSEQKTEILADAFATAIRTGDQWSAADSVLQVTHCSSPEFSEPSK